MKIPISAASLDHFLDLADDIALQIEAFEPADPDIDRHPRGALGSDLACEAFMVEREELIAAIDNMAVAIDNRAAAAQAYMDALTACREDNDRLRRDQEVANAAFHRISTYANALAGALDQVGIQHHAGEDDQPVITLDAEIMLEVLEAIAGNRAG